MVYDAKALEEMDESLTEAAGRKLVKRKEDRRRDKEASREFFKKKKGKPRSLDKDLERWARDLKEKRGKISMEKSPDFIKEGVARVIAKNFGNPIKINLKSASKSSINKSINSKKGNTSEIKFDAKGFRTFMSWNKNENRVDSGSNDIKELLRKGGQGTIGLEFATPSKPDNKAFDGWVTGAGRKRASEGASSAKKSTAKKPKL